MSLNYTIMKFHIKNIDNFTKMALHDKVYNVL
jgi:hypothetical protein